MTSSKKNIDEQETQMNSPYKINQNTFYLTTPQDKCILLNEVQQQEPMSLTQAELYSRDLVREVMTASKNRTLKHQINKISKNTSLYAKPLIRNPNEFLFNSIPPANPHYSSSSSAKIKQINHGLHNRPSTASTLASHRYHSVSASQHSLAPTQHRAPRVSVSGLVTYKFNSVNAQRSVGLNRINHEERLKEEIKMSNKSRECSGNRLKKIILKHSSKRYNDYVRKENNIMDNFSCSTQDYLKQIKKDNQQQMLVYGEKAKKLNFIKDYMTSEGTNYEEGRHIINQIDKFQQEKSHMIHRRVVKTQANEDMQLEQRRKPRYQKKLKIRYITFVE